MRKEKLKNKLSLLLITAIVCCLGLMSIPAGAEKQDDQEKPRLFKASPPESLSKSQKALPPVSGTKAIGPTGDYASIGTAINDIQTQGLGGALLLELQPTYLSNVETFPLNITALTGISPTNTVTLRPQVGATNLEITGDDATVIINLEAVEFFSIDGRPGGTGTAKELTIENTNTNGATVRFINEASNNNLRFVILKGATTNPTNGVVFFSTTNGPNGNDDNTISNCDIRDGVSEPLYCVFASGTTATTAQNNSGNTISETNLFNFFSTVNDPMAARINSGNTRWDFVSNSVFQTVPRSGSGRTSYGFNINNTLGDGFNISDNFVGGSEPNAGGVAWRNIGTGLPARLVAFDLNLGTSAVTSVQGNTVKNFQWETSSADSSNQGAFCAFFVQRGAYEIGTTNGNTVGAETGTGSINVTTSGDGAAIKGVSTFGFAIRDFKNFKIGSIKTNGTGPGVSASIISVEFVNGFNTFSQSTIGSTTTPHSIDASNSSTSATGQKVIAVLSSSGSGSIIDDVTVSNLNNNYTGTDQAGQTIGIQTTRGSNTITENDISKLSTTSGNTGSGDDASVFGIAQTSTSSGQTISKNTAHSLFSSNPGPVTVTGIRNVGNSSGPSEVSGNSVWTAFAPGGTSIGFQVVNETRVVNNTARLGIDENSNDQTEASSMIALDDETGFSPVVNNTLVILGQNVETGSADTVALRTLIRAAQPVIVNNIFVNDRSNATTGGIHINVNVLNALGPGVAPNPVSNHNIFQASGNGGAFGSYNGTDIQTLEDWRLFTGLDPSSAVVDPLFIDALAGIPDLRLQSTNPAEGAGTNIFPVLLDADGQDRSALTPVDIGAYAGNHTSSGDFFPPFIEFELLPNGSVNDRLLTGWLTVTDNVGIAAGALAPRLYFNKNGGSYVSTRCITFNGLTEQSERFTCQTDYSLVGGVVPGDTISYFAIAQDLSGNVSTNSVGGVATDVNTVTTPPLAPKSYLIVPSISGPKNIGAGGDFPNLTGPGGLFEAINNSVLTGPLDLTITDDLTEDGTNPLNKIAKDDPNSTITVVFRPGDATQKIISGNVAVAMVRLQDIKDVTFDGSFGGSGNFLTFDNADTSNPTIRIEGAAGNDTLKNVNVRGANTNSNSGVLEINGGPGNDIIIIDGVNVSESSAGGTLPTNLLFSQGDGSGASVENLIVRNSNFVNFTKTAIFAHDNKSALFSNNLICSDGSLLLSLAPSDVACGLTPRDTNLFGVDAEGDFIVERTTVRLITEGFFTIAFRVSGESVILRRLRAVVGSPDGSPGLKIGVESFGGGDTSIINSQFTFNSDNSDQQIIAIDNEGFFGSGKFEVLYTTVFIDGTASGSDTTTAYQKGSSAATDDILRNNYFFNNRTGGGADHFAVRLLSTEGSFDSDNNIWVGTGAGNPTEIFEIQFTPQAFFDWQTGTGGDLNSLAGNPGGQFTGDIFKDASVGNLDITPFETSPLVGGTGYEAPPIVSNAGTPVAGVTTDFGGTDTRHPVHPDIGSDEGDINRTLSTDGTLPPGNYDNITVENGVTATLGGLTNIGGTFFLDCTGAVSGASSTNYIIGNVRKDFCSPGAFNYPVGTGTGFSPVDVNITNLATNPSGLEIRANDGVAPAAPPLDGASVLNRFWTINETGDLTADLLFNYLQTDVFGDESQYVIIRVPGSGLAQYLANNPACDPDGPVTDISPCVYWNGPNQMFISDITEFSDWAAGIPLAPTAAGVSVQGRVIVGKNSGIQNALVSLTGGSLTSPQTARTNQFGYFSFEDVEVGQVYVLSVRHKQYGFAQNSQVFMLTEDLKEIVFEATWEN